VTGIDVVVVPLPKKKKDRPGQHNVNDVDGGSVVLARTGKKNRPDTTVISYIVVRTKKKSLDEYCR